MALCAGKTQAARSNMESGVSGWKFAWVRGSWSYGLLERGQGGIGADGRRRGRTRCGASRCGVFGNVALMAFTALTRAGFLIAFLVARRFAGLVFFLPRFGVFAMRGR